MLKFIENRRVKKMTEQMFRIKRLIILGWTIEDIAKKFKMSEEEVKMYMYL